MGAFKKIRLAKSIFILGLFFLGFITSPSPVQAKDIPHKLSDPFTRPVVSRREGLFLQEYQLEYHNGEIIFSSTPDGNGQTLTDDSIRFEVIKPSGQNSFYFSEYEDSCGPLKPQAPKDLTSMFAEGINTVRVLIRDICGGHIGTTGVYLVNKNAETDHPQGFLRLPWDYESKNLTFNEAALSMSSYFDHEYPFLSVKSLSDLDPIETIIFNKTQRSDESYSSHDGYDFARNSKIGLETPVLAAESGWVSLIDRVKCKACGYAVVIDHENGYQTRYYHMIENSQIVKNLNEKIHVNKGDVIGLVGLTGNTDGYHIHFMVVQDKNNDGNFEDNIPDGLVDPYGWQSTEPDPWENFSFFYNNLQRTGNKSTYLWEKQLDNLDMTLSSNGGQFKTERFELNFPQNFTNENLKLKMTAQPSTQTENNLRSIGSTIKATLQKTNGEFISQFPAIYELLIDYRNRGEDFLTIDPLTLSIYSSNDGITWVKEATIIDPENFKAKANLNHMTYFALMGQRIDTQPPTTTVEVTGEKGSDNWYRSDIEIRLNSNDNENGLGVAYTLYRLDSTQDWERYTTPLQITDEGYHKVEFYSVDNDENIEDINSLELTIDKTIPEAKISVDQDQLNLKVEGIDNNPTQVEIEEMNGKNSYNYKIKDLAGNMTELLVKYKDKEKKDDFQVQEIRYNEGNPIQLDKNSFKFSYRKHKDKLKIEKQSFDSEDKKKKPEVKLEYNVEKDETKIEEQIDGKKVKSTQPGFKLLQVQTKGGTLEYSY